MKFNWTVRLDMGFVHFSDAEVQARAVKKFCDDVWPETSRNAWKNITLNGLTEAEMRMKLNHMLQTDPQLSLRACVKDVKIRNAKSIDDPIPATVVWIPIGNLHMADTGGGGRIVYEPENGGSKQEFSFQFDELNRACLIATHITTSPVGEAAETKGRP